MVKVKKGDRVRINFIGRLEDGTVFDTTYEDVGCGCGDDDCEVGPIEVVVGEEDFFVPAEQALIGMSVGDKKTVTVLAADAFGEYDVELVFEIERSELPEDMAPEVDEELELTDEDDEAVMVTVLDTSETSITVDANHPLASENLTIEMELVEIL
jgi:peptidylprolyl isomerase